MENTNQQNNYYTPTIDEFHVGFEFQSENDNTKEWYSFNWEETYSCLIEDLTQAIKDETIRVKYLDKEDIKRFNFCLIHEESILLHEKPCSLYKKPVRHRGSKADCTLVYNKYNQWLLVIVDNQTVFTGIIKNKSELTKLFKQLYISLQC